MNVEGLRFLGFRLKMKSFSENSLKKESIGSEVRSVFFGPSVFSKNVCNSDKGQTNIND